MDGLGGGDCGETARVCRTILKMIRLKKLPPDKAKEFTGVLQRLFRGSDLPWLKDCGLLTMPSLRWDSVTSSTALQLLATLLNSNSLDSVVGTFAAHLMYSSNMDQSQQEAFASAILNSEGDVPVSLMELAVDHIPKIVERAVIADLLLGGQSGKSVRWHRWCSRSSRLFRWASGVLCRAMTVVTTPASDSPSHTSPLVHVFETATSFAHRVRQRCSGPGEFLLLYPRECRTTVALLLMDPGHLTISTSVTLLTGLDPVSRLVLLTHFPAWANIYRDHIISENSKF
ncbi:hypothetical protein AAG570_011829 [Ranatra chinensis]|uniref:Uncharacterized protein n=1 Tax=Ranatra chinensis TaxID=642074 RepID=A0ABD0Z3C4_9HEMI